MGLFRFKRLSGVPHDKNIIIFQVECGRCQEKIVVRVNKMSDLEDELPRAEDENRSNR